MNDLGPFPELPGYDEASQRDAEDPLGSYAGEFVVSDPNLIYLDGNSLGRLPRATRNHVATVVDDEWGTSLIRSWPERWWGLGEAIGAQLASLIGAAPDEVIVADSTSVVLFKLTLGALQAQPDRCRVVTDDLNFPSDNYVVAAAAGLADGATVTTVASGDGIHGPEDAIIDALDSDTALLTLSHVVFKSGYQYDLARLTAAAHQVGALVLWDLSHSVGAVPIDLGAAGADLAVGCTYKYLNGGPGAPAFLYVNSAVAAEIPNPITGWWGHREPFAFDLDYQPADGIRRFQTGTMPILSLAALETGLEVTSRAGVAAIREKSIRLSEFFISYAERILGPFGFAMASPRNANRRGSHVSLRHQDGWQIVQAMVDAAKVIPDFRDPDNIRFGLAPLYTSFGDVHTAIGRIERIVAGRRHEEYPRTRRTVT